MGMSVRLGDHDSGHGGFPSRPNVEGSPNHNINGKAAHLVGDAWASHSDGRSSHASVAATGSPNVRTNGKARCRINDNVACGSTMVEGSPNVRING